MNTLRDRIQNLVSQFKFEKEVSKKSRGLITIAVSTEDKMDYDILQAKSGKTFSKLLQCTFRETIQKAKDLESEAI